MRMKIERSDSRTTPASCNTSLFSHARFPTNSDICVIFSFPGVALRTTVDTTSVLMALRKQWKKTEILIFITVQWHFNQPRSQGFSPPCSRRRKDLGTTLTFQSLKDVIYPSLVLARGHYCEITSQIPMACSSGTVHLSRWSNSGPPVLVTAHFHYQMGYIGVYST